MSDFGAALKAARPRAVAALRRFSGNLDAAEDAFQDAAERALTAWSEQGLPDNPTGWLITAGRNRLIDAARKGGREIQGDAPAPTHEDLEPTALDDDLLRLIFTCCHPALAVEHQVALTLKVIAGLSSADVAQAFLVPVRTMEQRLARARKKLSDKGIPFAVPEAAELPDRLEAVLATVYLIFNQGYSARAGALVDSRTCEEAIWLARLLLRLFPGDTELMGLLALMLCHHARHASRQAADGALVPLPRQDRSAWDGDLITEATALLRVALGRGRPGPYQTQAAIAALHCEAPDANATDWAQIAALYEILERQSRQLGAWASAQSQPIDSRDAMLARFESATAAHGGDSVERPPHWGGYRVWARACELWVEGAGRVHDRARFERELTVAGDTVTAGAWQGSRLQP